MKRKIRKKIAKGDKFGRLLVISPPVKNNSRYKVECRCTCGTVKIIMDYALKNGMTKSCGCLQREWVHKKNYKHGEAARGRRGGGYACWSSMIQRCCNENSPSRKDYGGRGIKVCRRWRTSFENFIKDMGPRPSSRHSIERENVNGNYEPGNCRWATDKEQANNTRHNRRITHQGVTKTLKEWAIFRNVSSSTMHRRFKMMSVADAIEKPIIKRPWRQTKNEQ